MGHRLPCLLALVLSSTLLAQGQAFIVDAAGGPGANFTDLQAAVSAVPSGSTLVVRQGTYGEVTIQAKTLTVIGGAMQDRDLRANSKGTPARAYSVSIRLLLQIRRSPPSHGLMSLYAEVDASGHCGEHDAGTGLSIGQGVMVSERDAEAATRPVQSTASRPAELLREAVRTHEPRARNCRTPSLTCSVQDADLETRVVSAQQLHSLQ
jgi:hypothetical protein